MFRNKQGATFLMILGMACWGVTFVLIKEALSYTGAYTFIYTRFTIAGIVMCLFFFRQLKQVNKQILLLGCILGFFLVVSIITQTIALQYTTSSKSAFITGLGVVFVPLINALLYNKKVPAWLEWIAIVLATLGLGLLTLTDGLSTLNIGDFLTLICAIAFSFYIIKVDIYSKKANPVLLTIVQIIFIACIAFVFALFMECPLVIPRGYEVWQAIIFCAIPATAVTFTIQNYYQRFVTPPLRVAIIFSLEPVFAAIAAYFYLGEQMTCWGVLGAILIFFSMIVPEFKKAHTPRQ